MLRTLRMVILVMVLTAPAAGVWAQDLVVPGSRGAAMGGSMAAAVDDGYGAWYNPAMLVTVEDFKFGIQYAALFSDVRTSVKDYGSLGHIPYMQVFDADDKLLQQQTRLRVDELFGREAEPKSLHLIDMHFALPVQRMIPKFPKRAAIGGYISVPGAGTSIVSVKGQTPDQPFFPVMGSRIQRLKMVVGGGVELIDEVLSIGASVSILANLDGNVGSLTPMSTFDPTVAQGEQEKPNPSKATFGQEIATAITPQFGLLVQPVKGIEIGAYYRFAQSMDLRFDVAAGVDVNMGYKLEAELPYYLMGSFFFVPAATGLGVSVSLVPDLIVSAQLDYVFWSDMSKKINISNFNVEPSVLNDQGGLTPLEEYGHFKVRSYPVPPIHARNTFNPRAGLEYGMFKGFTKLRLGYSYNPSALEEDQKYQNMLMDNSYHTIAGGIGFSLNDPLEWIRLPIMLDFHALVNVLVDRTNRVGLDDPDGGYHAKGWVESSGFMYGFGVDLTIQM